MNVDMNKNGDIKLTDVTNPIEIVTPNGATYRMIIRDDILDIKCVHVPTPTVEYFEDHLKGGFTKELRNLINEHSLEGGSDTQDIVLAEYLVQCLNTFDMCVRERDRLTSEEKQESISRTKMVADMVANNEDFAT